MPRGGVGRQGPEARSWSERTDPVIIAHRAFSIAGIRSRRVFPDRESPEQIQLNRMDAIDGGISRLARLAGPADDGRRMGRVPHRDGGPVIVSRESPTVTWLEIAPLRLRGYAVIEDGHVTAINFELSDPDPRPADPGHRAAAAALGWEVHPDDGDDDDDED